MLKKLNRLRHRRDFKFIFKRGRASSSSYLLIRYHRNRLPVNRLATVISTKVSKSAVRRNRLRRRLQGVMETRLSELKSGNDIIIVVKKDFYSLNSQELNQQITQCLERTPLLKGQ